MRKFNPYGKISGWKILSILTALIIFIPIAIILSPILSPKPEIWGHLLEYIFFDIIKNSVILLIGTIIGTFFIGVSLAWLIAIFDFPGRNIFSWALLLPLAIPAYVTSFIFIGVFDYTGNINSYLRSYNIILPEIRSAGGLIIVMTLAFYPYVYLIVRNAFATQGKQTLEVSKSLGLTTAQSFYKTCLPMARPWIAASLIIVTMETLADFGAVSIFNYDVFTTAIYKSWFSMFSLEAALQLSSILIIIIFIIIIIEQYTRHHKNYKSLGKTGHRIKLTGFKSFIATFYALLILSISFFIPVIQLTIWAIDYIDIDLNSRYFGYFTHSIYLATIVAIITATISIIMATANRYHNDIITKFSIKISNIGYAVPGTVLAVGIFIAFAWIDNLIAQNTGTIFLQGTIFIMIIALVIRFMAVSYNPINNALNRTSISLDEAARTMGSNSININRKIHLPILKTSIFTAMTMTFVDVMKEMPITLMTRPFGWDTLSVRIFEMTSEGEWERAAIPSIAIVITGLIPIIIMNKHAER